MIQNTPLSFWLMVLTSFVWGSFSLPALAHPVYTSLTVLEWNDRANSLEVIIEIQAHELAAALSQLPGTNRSSTQPPDPATTTAYIQKHVALQIDGQLVALSSIGQETVQNTVLVYLETPWPRRPNKFTFINTLFIDAQRNQINSVIAKIGSQQRSAEITKETGPVTLEFDPAR